MRTAREMRDPRQMISHLRDAGRFFKEGEGHIGKGNGRYSDHGTYFAATVAYDEIALLFDDTGRARTSLLKQDFRLVVRTRRVEGAVPIVRLGLRRIDGASSRAGGRLAAEVVVRSILAERLVSGRHGQPRWGRRGRREEDGCGTSRGWTGSVVEPT